MRVHLIMQGKGGVGKTLASTLLAQYFLAHEKKIACFDTDPVNTSFAGYRSLNVKVLELMQDDEIKPRNFDKSVHEKGRNANGKSAGGRNAGPGSRNMEKIPGSKMNTAKSAGKKKGIRNIHKKKGN